MLDEIPEPPEETRGFFFCSRGRLDLSSGLMINGLPSLFRFNRLLLLCVSVLDLMFQIEIDVETFVCCCFLFKTLLPH
jgi:hypothetical protein